MCWAGCSSRSASARSFERACKASAPARALELCFDASDWTLLALPSEAARLDGTVLALTAGVTVRRVVAGAKILPARATASPLKVLVAVGAADEGRSPNAVLDLERELQRILDAVSPNARDGSVELRFLEVGHPGQIGRALEHDENIVVHLSGHGGPGVIELEDEDGAAESGRSARSVTEGDAGAAGAARPSALTA